MRYLTRNVNNIPKVTCYSRARSRLEKCVSERHHHSYSHQSKDGAQQVKLLTKFLAKQTANVEQDDVL